MRLVAALLALSGALACSSEPLATAAGDALPADTTPPPPGTTPSGGVSEFAPIAEYPPGPYGRTVGAVLQNHDFYGWRDPVAAAYDELALERVRLSDFYDPSGTGTKLLVINASAVWCSVCQTELRHIKDAQLYQRYRALGVEFLGTLFEDVNGGPARPSDLSLWGSSPVRAIEFPLVLDPALKLGQYFSSDATPLNLIVDAQTMQIVYVLMGYDGTPETGFWGVLERELERRGVALP